jgi:hypothetical protein
MHLNAFVWPYSSEGQRYLILNPDKGRQVVGIGHPTVLYRSGQSLKNTIAKGVSGQKVSAGYKRHNRAINAMQAAIRMFSRALRRERMCPLKRRQYEQIHKAGVVQLCAYHY